YPREVKLSVNDKAYETFMASDSDRIKALGMRKQGENISVKLTLTGENLYIKNDENILYYLDTEAFKYAMGLLAKEQYQIEEFTEKHFSGTLTTSKDSTLILTTIPYDEGWQIKVDGKRVPIEQSLEALVSFRIEGGGTHTVEMTYSPSIVNIGLGISLGSLAVYGGLLVADILRKRKKQKETQK
ncbi:MAG: YfhO family protein, partial [Clostridia bacterium]|nr:YfhO family protein [Clostridia bacterium]